MKCSALIIVLVAGMLTAAKSGIKDQVSGVRGRPEMSKDEHGPTRTNTDAAQCKMQNAKCKMGGGPDGFGYEYLSTQDPGDSISYQWIDATAGSPITNWSPDPDDGYAQLALPFRFPFYAETSAAINVCSNGFLETSTSTLYENTALPTPDIANLIAPFWDDLAPGSGAIFQYTPADSACFVIAFVDVVRYETPGDHETFEIVLYPDGRIRFNYGDVGGNRAANTIGIQGGTGDNEWYLQYVANGNPLTHVVRDSTSILFFTEHRTHDVGAVGVRSPAPVIAPGAAQRVVAKIRNFGAVTESFTAGGFLANTAYPFDTIFAIHSVPVTNLAPGETTLVDLGEVTPGYSGTWQVKLFTELAGDEQRNNDTARGTTSNAMPFGTQLGSWDLSDLPTGFVLGGITFCPDSHRFYVACRDPNQVYSFTSEDPVGTLRAESFQLLNLFGNDVIWGIAFDNLRQSFWIGHVEGTGSGTIVARYCADGTFSGDTWNLNSFEPGGWFAGMDYDPVHDRFYVARVGGSNAVYKLDLAGKHVMRIIPGGQESYRACSYLDVGTPWILSGGWNQNELLRLDTLGNQSTYSILDSLADCDIFQPRDPSPDSLIYVMATLNNQNNTIRKVSLGLTWRQLGITEGKPQAGSRKPQAASCLLSCPSPQANPIKIILSSQFLVPGTRNQEPGTREVRLAMYDLAGREMVVVNGLRPAAGVPLVVRIPRTIAPGTYFLVAESEGEGPQQKLVVVR